MKYIVAFAVVLYSATSMAHECSIFKDKNSVFEYGSYLLGEDVSKTKLTAVNPEACLISEAGVYLDCSLLDQKGVIYVVEEGYIIRKEYSFTNEENNLTLELRLEHKDSLLDVLNKLRRAKDVVWMLVQRDDGRSVLSSGFCIENSIGNTYEVSFLFDESDKLKKVVSRLNW